MFVCSKGASGRTGDRGPKGERVSGTLNTGDVSKHLHRPDFPHICGSTVRLF